MGGDSDRSSVMPGSESGGGDGGTHCDEQQRTGFLATATLR